MTDSPDADPDVIDEQVALLAAGMLERAEELAASATARIREAVPVYRSDAVPREVLYEAALNNVHRLFGRMGRVPSPADDDARGHGRARAQAGVPLSAVMEGYRVGAWYLWEQLAAAAVDIDLSGRSALLAASEVWSAMHTHTQQMADGYREELAERLVAQEQRRSALLQALLEGRLTETSLWEAADLLGLPHTGPYAVVVANVPSIGRHALPGIESLLGRAGIASVWRLGHDVEIGIACVSGSGNRFDRLVASLTSTGAGFIGVSPPYADLRETGSALRLARIALHSAFDGHQVVVFDRDPLAVTAASDPEVMQRVARTTLAGLDRVSIAERALLLETFGAWLDNGGSAERTAERLYVHANTVRHRLRRLEARTGRSLSDPRWVVELGLAYEVARRLGPGPIPSVDRTGRGAETAK
ncbi:PucR family transcriptional regulator [Streptomyces sp. NPDC007971]|uniref:PucR family transcriptional regulator n=1 Tax=Streptomyces sp. NPDC007971 TaxID=3364799 RepID=UPI0036F01C81